MASPIRTSLHLSAGPAQRFNFQDRVRRAKSWR